MHKITVQEFIDAVRKNGYKQAFGSLLQRNWDGEVAAACAVGQAYLNLKFRSANDPNIYNEPRLTLLGNQVEEYTMNLNDERYLDLDTIADKLEAHYAKSLDRVMYEVLFDRFLFVSIKARNK